MAAKLWFTAAKDSWRRFEDTEQTHRFALIKPTRAVVAANRPPKTFALTLALSPRRGKIAKALARIYRPLRRHYGRGRLVSR
jgi:hypothetical protein